ncbi:MAG: hypothetical protein ABII27_09890 [bacterium]
MNKLFFLIVIFLCFIGINADSADVYLGIESRGEKIDLGISQIQARNDLEIEHTVGEELRQIIMNDLLFSLYFNVVESDEPLFVEGVINFESWVKSSSDVLLVPYISLEHNFIGVQLKAYDVSGKTLIWTKNFYSSKRELRKLAHIVSDEIVLRFTGEKGIAQSKIAFINDSTGNKELYITDYDGRNIKRLTYNKSIALFPKWSPDNESICFTSYHHGNPDLFIISSDGVILKSISTRHGLNAAAQWAPDGESLALTLSIGRSPDIYQIDLQGKIIKQLTSGWGAEISPCFSPDGKQIVFTSDKPGFPQLYTIRIDQNLEHRLFSGKYSDSAAWSPKGDSIAFSMFNKYGKFDIFTVNTNGRSLRQLTQDAQKNENPSWSPDGRFIVFASNRNGEYELFMMSQDGSRQKRVFKVKGNCFTPDWGN